MSKFLIAGAGGFIGGHLAARLKQMGHDLVCADVKPYEYWFQMNDQNTN